MYVNCGVKHFVKISESYFFTEISDEHVKLE